MKWFKFYGQDFLTDSKIKSLSVEMRQCWVVLLCMANGEDKKGKLRFLNESEVMLLAGVEQDGQTWYETQGFLDVFKELEMITIDNVINNLYDVTLLNYQKRQGEAKTAYERVKEYRERNKKKINDNDDDNAASLSNRNKSLQNVIKNEANDNDDNENDNTRIDKSREDKNRNNIVRVDEQRVPASESNEIKPQERLPVEKQTHIHRIGYHYEDTCKTKITNWGKQGKAISTMLKAGFTESEIIRCITYMSRGHPFYQDKGFDLTTVSNEIGRLKARERNV
jgi:hypothetical protein